MQKVLRATPVSFATVCNSLFQMFAESPARRIAAVSPPIDGEAVAKMIANTRPSCVSSGSPKIHY